MIVVKTTGNKIDPRFARAHFRTVISSGEVSTIKLAIQSVRTPRKIVSTEDEGNNSVAYFWIVDD
jgi:hypothetical protein